MKLRLFAALLATAALSACGGDLLADDHDLLGVWTSNRTTIQATLPDGPRTVETYLDVQFYPDHIYFRQQVLESADHRFKAIEFAEYGTFTTRAGFVHLSVQRSYARNGGEPLQFAVLQPSSGGVAAYSYSVSGNTLTLDTCSRIAACPFDLSHFVRVEGGAAAAR